ncbi:hypothetical protein CSIM01_03449 [Colletotrichum simmondsii]|uniref:HNH nuclease domain-containing protein n=1 Tax=Colletotrichum simmondsii TaxID=703756 RepID=A0A135RYW1_9PEZI|nr:hypothetical protein CSIM01_03449 [Colletotrichum simmondsii]
MASRYNNGWVGDQGEVDLTERFELVQQIRGTILNHEDIKNDLPRLRSFLAEVQESGGLVYTLNLAFNRMNALVLLFRGPNAEWAKAGHLSWNNIERIATVQRDVGTCPFTGSEQGKKCHILPFWTLNRPRCSEALDAAVAVYGRERIKMLRKKLVNTQTNIVDTSANMITLSPALHKLWKQGMFGLEPVALLYEEGKEEEAATVCSSTLKQPRDTKLTEEASDPARRLIGIRIRFHWLRKTTGLTPDTLPKNIFELRRTWGLWEPEFAIIDSRHLEDGRIIEIFDNLNDKAPDFDILQLQLDVFRQQALSGRADPITYAPDWYLDDDGEIIRKPLPGKKEATLPHQST